MILVIGKSGVARFLVALSGAADWNQDALET